MPKRSSNHEDENQVAARVVALSTGQSMPKGKNPAAVALGRLGGLKGGRARAKALSSAQKRKIARKAATARWSRQTTE